MGKLIIMIQTIPLLIDAGFDLDKHKIESHITDNGIQYFELID